MVSVDSLEHLAKYVEAFILLSHSALIQHAMLLLFLSYGEGFCSSSLSLKLCAFCSCRGGSFGENSLAAAS